MNAAPQQLSLTLAAPRRLDVTIERLAEIHDSLSEIERADLAGKNWWLICVLVQRIRAAERAEEDVLGHSIASIADTYDEVVTPGEHLAMALVRTFKTHHRNVPVVNGYPAEASNQPQVTK